MIPSHRNRGIGTALIAEAERRARDLGLVEEVVIWMEKRLDVAN